MSEQEVVYTRTFDDHAEAYATITGQALLYLITNLKNSDWAPVAIDRLVDTIKDEAMRQAGLS